MAPPAAWRDIGGAIGARGTRSNPKEPVSQQISDGGLPVLTTRARVDFVAYSSAPTTAASMGSISPAARKSGNTKPLSPVTSSPAVAKGKVVVATADGQGICFG
jgi:hypothetical protein